MVCSATLGFILLFLLHPALGVVNLQRIINYLRNNYGVNNQYALGINVPVTYCNNDADLDQSFLLQDRNARQVRNDMAGSDRIYRGTQLIGARPKPINGRINNYHSEYLLLIHSMSQTLAHFDPLMQTLLNSDPNGCTVFFTLNSPCVKTCSTPDRPNRPKPYSIIPALQMFQNRKTPKAFVFSKIWDEDSDDWRANIKVINNIIPVYRCDGQGCTRCVVKNVVNQRCLQNEPHG